MDLMTATAAQLLAASPGDWRRGLGASAAAMRQLVRRLAQRWHPDHSPDPQAAEVFARLQEERRRWTQAAAPKEKVWTTAAGQAWALRYLLGFDQEWGPAYIGRRVWVETFAPDNADLALRAQAPDRLWTFASDAMRTQIFPCLPVAATLHRMEDQVVLVHPRDPGLIRLTDLMTHLGSVPPVHVAWIGSGLWNLACYLEFANLGHQAIQADTIWVDPALHRVALLGGWAYAGRLGERWAALPAHTLRWAPSAIRSAAVQSAALDHELIRALLRTLLGDPQGQNFPSDVPSALAAFARLPAGGTAVTQYAAWKQACVASFGKPTFVKLDLLPSLIYPEN
jgi:hypothetical protein